MAYLQTVYDEKCEELTEAIVKILQPQIMLRILDTHEANGPMRHKLEKNGFTYCGIIYVEDGTPRRAYQKVKI